MRARLQFRRVAPLWCRRDYGWRHPLQSWRMFMFQVLPGVVDLWIGPFHVAYWRRWRCLD